MMNFDEDKMDKVNRCYGSLDFTSIHFHISEMLTGHEQESTERFFRSTHYSLPFDWNHLQLLVTGLPQNLYHSCLNWSQNEAAQFFAFRYKPEVDRLLNLYGYSGLSIIFLFDGRKHYVTLFSPIAEKAQNAWKMAEAINHFLQQEYNRILSFAPLEICNITALSQPIDCYDKIADQFRDTRNLVKLSWFLKQSLVIDEKWKNQQALQIDKTLLLNEFQGLMNQSLDIESSKLRCGLETIFNNAGKTLDFSLVQDLLTFCRETLSNLMITYDLPGKDKLDTVFRYSNYPFFSQCCSSIIQTVMEIIQEITRSGRRYSFLTTQIIHELHRSYTHSLTIEQIAQRVHAAPNYCSTLFKKETGQTILEALIKIRISAACQLLENNELKIKEIASACGFGTARYFSEVFQHHIHQTPSQWRNHTSPIK